ncbi:MAG TPA: NAD-glutamate dehydrogenase [Devosiaceae bacterium]|nr:NAD-glutamate dehydrogenase [Devosiaceae bacterium]
MEAEGDSRGARTQSQLIARGKALVASEPNYARFLLHAARATDPDDLAPFSGAVMDAEFRRAYALIERRGTANHFVHLSRADVLTLEAPEIIDIFCPDMPFIVDSVLAAIRAKGGNVRLVTHPVLPLDPASHRVLNEAGPDTRQESFLHLHLDPLPDEASRKALLAEIRGVLDEVTLVVRGWRPMLERVRGLVHDLRENPPPIEPALVAESVQFLAWLAAHNFTFLGLREYRVAGSPAAPRLEPVPTSGIGLLENPDFRFLRSGRNFVETTPEHVAFLQRPDPVMVSKANMRSRVHRRTHMDYIGVKRFDAHGKVSGEVRILGLFTSAAAAVPHTEVPLIRRKVATVLARSRATPESHAGKALLQALATYPRDELFQIDADDLLEFATVVAALPDRPRVRVLPRIDRFDNFVSILVYLPRDRYTSELCARIGTYLARRYEGGVSAYFPQFPEGDLVRVHFIIGRDEGSTPRPDREDLERDILDLSRDFGDRVLDAAPDEAAVRPFRAAFPPAYQASATPADALADIEVFRGLGEGVAVRLAPAAEDGGFILKVFHRENPLPLSDRVPLLESFGFRVIDEATYAISPEGQPACFLHAMELTLPEGPLPADPMDIARIEEALLAVWHGEAESDRLNQLSISAGLAWDQVAILRAYARYLKQLGGTFSQRYVAATLSGHPDAAAAFFDLFDALNRPDFNEDRDAAAEMARAAIAAALETTQSLDEDRILRRVLALIEATLRTNFYQRDSLGGRRPALGLKFDCAAIAEMPAPKPFREIFVYSPRLEGLHLRFGPLARGGIRWSDRPEDFRTEVLGLVKAQQAKNAIIVPVGAKGAFVPRQVSFAADRETVQSEGTACYGIFISTLLDLTDNIVGGSVVSPPELHRRDAADPYLVVAADKGTASFSDIANALAVERHYWLGDAFASGGSVGYDHKRMGITARGAWEGVKRHFREMGRDIQQVPFTVVGIGDMSGDVFGNGMLLSPHTLLIAAFDHRDIFIDPAPNPVAAFAERKRLFGRFRSSWQDYDREAISPGGGVFSRELKSVDLSAEARAVLGLAEGPLMPRQVIRAILTADVDLLWFGGIGTYVRGANETDLEVGDKANDQLRVTGHEVRARVIGEGANLAMTERGRIEYALTGGRLNTDAIDNSAGVNASDLEVNIKIALGPLVAAKRISERQRNDLLMTMTSEVAELCLRNNYLQTLALSLAERQGLDGFAEQRGLLAHLEANAGLSRAVEFLPTDAELGARAAAGHGFTRPELAVLLAYAKIALKRNLAATGAPDDPYLSRELFAYFPARLAEQHREALEQHRLRREVIATVLANAMLNRGGPDFVLGLVSATNADAAAAARAYVTARDAFGLTELNRQIDLLDGRIPGTAQLDLYAAVEALLKQQSLWFLRNETFEGGLAELIARYALGVADLRNGLQKFLPPPLAAAITTRNAALEAAGVPRDLARRFAELPIVALASDIVLVANRAGTNVADAARAFFAVIEMFGLGQIAEAAGRLRPADRFDRMALDRALANIARAERDLAADVLAADGVTVAGRLATWRRTREAAIERAARAVGELTEGEVSVSRLSVTAGLLADLAQAR